MTKPSRLRASDLPMIDLTRHLPTLESTLSPTHHPEPDSLFVTSLKALALGFCFLAGVYLAFGFQR
jgi:hypothetical protein